MFDAVLCCNSATQLVIHLADAQGNPSGFPKTSQMQLTYFPGTDYKNSLHDALFAADAVSL